MAYGIFFSFLCYFFCNKHSRPSCFGNQFWHRDCRVTAEAALLGHLPFQIFQIFQTWMTLNDRMTKICRIKEHGVYVLLRSSQYGVLHRFSKEKSKHISVGQRGIPTQWDFYKVKTINVYGFRTLEPELDSFISFMQPFYTCTTLSWALTIVFILPLLAPPPCLWTCWSHKASMAGTSPDGSCHWVLELCSFTRRLDWLSVGYLYSIPFNGWDLGFPRYFKEAIIFPIPTKTESLLEHTFFGAQKVLRWGCKVLAGQCLCRKCIHI